MLALLAVVIILFWLGSVLMPRVNETEQQAADIFFKQSVAAIERKSTDDS